MEEIVLVLRSVKGEPLTHEEMDANFAAIKEFIDSLVGFSIDTESTMNVLNNNLVGNKDDRLALSESYPPSIPFFDIDLNKPVWKTPDGEWVDANGNSVDVQDM